jgi:hypothetical protein
MRELLIDQDWRGTAWRVRATGAGVVNAVNGILTTTSGAGDASMLDYFVPILPGMRVEVEALGQWVSGLAGIYIDEIDGGTGAAAIKQQNEMTARNDWRPVAVAYTVPQITTAKFLRIVIGVTTAQAGSAKWQLPIIRIGRGFGAPICLARGLLRVTNGVPDWHPNFTSFGMHVVAPVFNGSDTMTVTLDHQLMGTPQNERPIVHCSGVSDHATVPVAGGVAVVAGVGTFLVKWSTGAAFENIAAVTRFAMLSVWL